MKINVKELENLRDEEEIRRYFLDKNINLSTEEIFELKENYNLKTNTNNKLTNDQLDKVAGGLLFGYNGKVCTTFNGKPPGFPEEHWGKAQIIFSIIQLDTLQNSGKFAYRISGKPYSLYNVTTPHYVNICYDSSSPDECKFIFYRVGSDLWGETRLREYAKEKYPEKNSSFLHFVLSQEKLDPDYDPSSAEGFELWQIARANDAKFEYMTPFSSPIVLAFVSKGAGSCFLHSHKSDGSYTTYTFKDICDLFTDEHYDRATGIGYIGLDCLSSDSMYGKIVYTHPTITPYNLNDFIPHDEPPKSDPHVKTDQRQEERIYRGEKTYPDTSPKPREKTYSDPPRKSKENTCSFFSSPFRLF